MQNPFRDGGPLDIAIGLLGLLVSIALLWTGIGMARSGGSWWWSLTAGGLVVLNVYGLYRRRPSKGHSSR